MNLCHDPCARAVIIIVLEQQFPGFIVEGAFRVGVDEQTFYYGEDVCQRVRADPVFLESVDANFARPRYVRMEYLSRKPACEGGKQSVSA